MDDRTRMFFEEFLARGFMVFVFALMFSGGFLNGLSGEELFYAIGIIGACLAGSFALLILKMYFGSGEISFLSYSGLETLPYKIAMWALAGGLTSAVLLSFFPISVWGQVTVGSWALLAVLVIVWWRMS